MFKPKYKPNQLICGNGNVAITTGWTVKTQIAKRLTEADYAVIGNLYSPTRGISFLLRNLFVNPHVHSLVILDATKEDQNAGGSQCLFDFFTKGFRQGETELGKPCWLVNSAVTGYIDLEIDELSLTELRESIMVKKVNSIDEAIAIAKSFNQLKEQTRESKTFPLIEVESKGISGERYGHRIEGQTIAETWIKILHRIKTTGTIRPTGYDGNWQELIDLMAVIKDEPINCYFPDPNYLPIDREYLDNYIGQILDDAPYTEGVKYTYGQRLRSWFGKDQIKQVIQKLITEIDSASAVMSLWDSGSGSWESLGYTDCQDAINPATERFGRNQGDSDHDRGGSPCLNHIWLRVVDNELSLTATFRSNDMFSAWVANAMGLRYLQQHIRDEIAQNSDYDLRLGPLITISQSAHIYDDTWENIDSLIRKYYPNINKVNYNDAVGNYLIELENEQITVKQITASNGEIIRSYRGSNPLKLMRKIVHDSPAIAPNHIGYLGIELQKASQCLLDKKIYTQDK